MAYFFFDLEAGGLYGERSSIQSVSWKTETAEKSMYAPHVPGTYTTKWAQENVWKPIQERTGGIYSHSEEGLIKDFIGDLKALPRDTKVLGWNIGYEAVPQSMYPPGYDLPMLTTRAQQYGLMGELQEATKGLKIVDVGQEYVSKIASEIGDYSHLVDKGLLDKDIYTQYEGYMKRAEFSGLDITQDAEEMARRGTRVAGWKQELIAEAKGILGTGAHQSEADVAQGVALYNRLQSGERLFQSEDDVIRWGRGALKNKMMSSLIHPTKTDETLFSSIMETAREAEARGGPHYQGFLADVEQTLAKQVEVSGLDIGEIRAGRGSVEKLFRVGESGGLTEHKGLGKLATEISEGASKFASAHPVLAGIIGVGGFMAARSVIFSSPSKTKEDYNVIEGLKHGGMAQDSRRSHSAFGSGWDYLRGLAKHLEIDFGEMVGSAEFKSALKAAVPVKQFEAGAYTSVAGGGVSLMESAFKHPSTGESIPFQFVRKKGVIGKYEVEAMKAFENDFAPSVYGHSVTNKATNEGIIDMEYFAGKSFQRQREALQKLDPARVETQEGYANLIQRTVSQETIIADAGWSHGDISYGGPHLNNIMDISTPQGTKIGVIDWGTAAPSGSRREATITKEAEILLMNSMREADTVPPNALRSGPIKAKRKVSMQKSNLEASKQLWHNSNTGQANSARRHVSRGKK